MARTKKLLHGIFLAGVAILVVAFLKDSKAVGATGLVLALASALILYGIKIAVRFDEQLEQIESE